MTRGPGHTPAAGGGRQADPGPGELANGELGRLARVVDELVGIGQEGGQDARGGQLLLVRQVPGA